MEIEKLTKSVFELKTSVATLVERMGNLTTRIEELVDDRKEYVTKEIFQNKIDLINAKNQTPNRIAYGLAVMALIAIVGQILDSVS